MKNEKFTSIEDAALAAKTLRHFIGNSQLIVMANGCRGGESNFFKSKMVEMADTIATMPETYEQDGKGEDAIAYLHYFRGNMDFYITEKDCDPDGEGQIQAFGTADLGYGAELGYINIAELIANGVELDLHFTPTALKNLK